MPKFYYTSITITKGSHRSKPVTFRKEDLRPNFWLHWINLYNSNNHYTLAQRTPTPPLPIITTD